MKDFERKEEEVIIKYLWSKGLGCEWIYKDVLNFLGEKIGFQSAKEVNS